MKEKYILGLDLGITSIGWACVTVESDINENNKFAPKRILDLGSYIIPSDGRDNPVEIRRNKRGAGRVSRRRKDRVRKTRNLFIKHEIMTKEEAVNFFCTKGVTRPLALEAKVKGLKEKLSINELFVVLNHYANHRGFKSNRKVLDEAKKKVNDDEGKLLQAISATSRIMKEKNLVYPSEFSYELYKENPKQKIRNTTDTYLFGFRRDDITEELDILLETQVKLGLINKEFKNEYMNIFQFQRSFDEGPMDGPYKDPLENMIGSCKFDNKDRASKSSPSYEKFIMLQKLNDLRYKIPKQSKEIYRLTSEQITLLMKKAINNSKISYSDVVNHIDTDEVIRFESLKLSRNDWKEIYKVQNSETITLEQARFQVEKKKDLHLFKHFPKLIKNLKKLGINTTDIHISVLDSIVDTLSRKKSDDGIRKRLESLKFNNEMIDIVLNLESKDYTEFGALSFDILYKITPLMEQGIDYTEAMMLIGKDHSKRKKSNTEFDKMLPILELFERLNKNITNRSVIKLLTETRKLINEIIKKYGKPEKINVETTRDLARSIKERDDVLNRQLDNQNNNIRLKGKIVEDKIGNFSSIHDVKSNDLLKYKLYGEQNGICFYTFAQTGDIQESKIPYNMLFSSHLEIDHIIPYSLSLDDTFSNKILVYKKTNQEKGAKIPYKAFKDKLGWSRFVEYVKTQKDMSAQKRANLTSESFMPDLEFTARAINDTGYIARAISECLEYNFPKIEIQMFSGNFTSQMRGIWGLDHKTHSYQSKNYELPREVKTDEITSIMEKVAQLDIELETNLDMDKSIITQKRKDRQKLLFEARKILSESELKKSRNNHLHHALDAVVIACLSKSLYAKVLREKAFMEAQRKGLESITLTNIFHDTLLNNSMTLELNVEKHKAEYKKNQEKFTKSHFPLPYPQFQEETIYRVYERDTEELKSKLKQLSNYTNYHVDKARPIIIAHRKPKSISGQLHKETVYGGVETESGTILRSRHPIKSDKFKKETLEKMFEKNGTQKSVYEAIKHWLGSNANGEVAFKANKNQYPCNKNGNEIKKVYIEEGNVKQEILINESSKQYVGIADVIQVNVYKHIETEKIYFSGIDRYRANNWNKKEFDIILWERQGEKNSIKIPHNKPLEHNLKPILEIQKGQYIILELNSKDYGPEKKGLVRLIGFSSGMLGVNTILGDQFDLFKYNFISEIGTPQYQPTVSTIKSIQIVKIDRLGNIKYGRKTTLR